MVTGTRHFFTRDGETARQLLEKKFKWGRLVSMAIPFLWRSIVFVVGKRLCVWSFGTPAWARWCRFYTRMKTITARWPNRFARVSQSSLCQHEVICCEVLKIMSQFTK